MYVFIRVYYIYIYIYVYIYIYYTVYIYIYIYTYVYTHIFIQYVCIYTIHHILLRRPGFDRQRGHQGQGHQGQGSLLRFLDISASSCFKGWIHVSAPTACVHVIQAKDLFCAGCASTIKGGVQIETETLSN